MSAPPPNRPGPYTYSTNQEVPPSQVGTVPPLIQVEPEPLEPSFIETKQPRLRPVPLWIPIIGIGCLVAAVIFGVANINSAPPTVLTPTAAAASAITATEGTINTAEAGATPTIVQVVVPPSTPTAQVAGQPVDQTAPTATVPPADTVQPTAANPVAPTLTLAPPEPTATPRPAPTVPPAVPQTALPVVPNQPLPTATQAPAQTATQAPAPTVSLPPSATQVAATPAATQIAGPTATGGAPTQGSLDSQGLGLFKTEWEKWHGQGDQKDNGIYYENQKYLVVFYEDRITRLERLYTADLTSIDAARTESKNFLPQDVQLVQSYIGPDNVPVDLYKSESLKTYFAGVNDPEFWKGGEAGNFIVQYRKSDQPNLFTAIVVTLGNNPQQNP